MGEGEEYRAFEMKTLHTDIAPCIHEIRNQNSPPVITWFAAAADTVQNQSTGKLAILKSVMVRFGTMTEFASTHVNKVVRYGKEVLS